MEKYMLGKHQRKLITEVKHKVYTWKDTLATARVVEASTENEAIEKFKEMEVYELEADEYELMKVVDFIDDVRVTTTSSFNATSEADTLMREVKYQKYHFIEDDNTHFKNEGYCVRDHIVGKYSGKIKKLTNEYYDK